jgi:hypothetical protein
VRLEVALDDVEELEEFQSLNGAVQPHELGDTR